MLVTFNPAKSDILYEEFENKDQWKSYVERYNSPGQPKPVNENPEKFPCLMLYDGNILPTPDLRFSNFFIYYYANA